MLKDCLQFQVCISEDKNSMFETFLEYLAQDRNLKDFVWNYLDP